MRLGLYAAGIASRPCLNWWTVAAVVPLTIGAACAQPEFCLRDADDDGHPMFGNPQVRTGFEVYQGVNYASAQAVAVAFGDMDGDGDADAVAISNWPHVQANPPLHFVTVHCNAGDGVFEAADVPYPVGAEGTDIALADLDGEGDLDAAVANARADSVSILLNHGDGTFAAHVTYSAGQMPRSVRIADLDGDEDADLVLLNILSNDVSVLLNEGHGIFAPEVRLPVGNVTPRGHGNLNFSYPGPFLAVGDVDGDGDIDIAVPAKSQVKLLLNDGGGAFALAPSHASVAVSNAYCPVLVDLDGDGDLDLACSTHSPAGGVNCLSIMRNIGTGVFAGPVPYNAAWSNSPTAVQYATALTGGDIDRDGDADLLVGHEKGSQVMLMRNAGDGTFGPKEPLHVFTNPWYVSLAELNRDGRLDLGVLTFAIRPKLCVLLNDDHGSLIADMRYPGLPGGCCQGWVSLASEDLDGDGDLDLLATTNNSQYPYHVKVLLNDGKGAFDHITSYALGPPGTATGESVSIGDLSGDAVPDLVVCDAIVPGGFDQPGKVWVMKGLGNGAFDLPAPYPLAGQIPLYSAIADLDQDGDPDVAVWTVQTYPGNDVTPVDRRIVVLTNDGRGALEVSAEHLVATMPWYTWGGVTAFDADGDGRIDLAATASPKYAPGSIRVLRNVGQGVFQLSSTHVVPQFCRVVREMDVDGDARADLVVGSGVSPSNGFVYLSILRNLGGGQFQEPVQYSDSRVSGTNHFAAAQIDGEWTLAFTNDFGTVMIVPATGPNTRRARHYGVGNWPTAVALGDFDGDGRVDVAASNDLDAYASVLLNRDCGDCYPDCSGDNQLTVADFGCFQTRFVAGNFYADCNTDGALTVADFGCFQTAFVQGCR